MANKIDRIGEINISNEGCLMKIVEYNEAKDIVIEFQDEHRYRVHTRYEHFKKGNCKNPFFPSVCGHGYLGVDKNEKVPKTKEFKNDRWRGTWEYDKWKNMLERCYDNKLKERNPTYKNVTCCERWLCFAYFLEDLEKLKQEYNWNEDEKLNLDKDILNKNNKLFNLESCILIPSYINTLFIKRDASRGKYPIGVCYHKQGKKYQAKCSINGEQKRLGHYDTIEQAFYVYKQAKEQEIKRVANECVFKGYVNKDSRLYKAMIDYQVEIND